eukprot:CAMPEP_0113298418 /NCGR_PEP_ID=MMETSP0010_2-20120614/872_1 /TAXON_ID=216773 ORGANISM="Corethron hystrix, Strain 308" /NCGR_SAMPLE_ID=MMETSP0010_2 /ASSEMBLY_ACC=CAM_ASM_000155 /LENGTH=207 /DNA_ID=CAMNT_0000151471 /DNA_START=47 /DNA_END=666 /DNA_ORIENTATION=- /assembly_acc=CAM_ASM_000155
MGASIWSVMSNIVLPPGAALLVFVTFPMPDFLSAAATALVSLLMDMRLFRVGGFGVTLFAFLFALALFAFATQCHEIYTLTHRRFGGGKAEGAADRHQGGHLAGGAEFLDEHVHRHGLLVSVPVPQRAEEVFAAEGGGRRVGSASKSGVGARRVRERAVSRRADMPRRVSSVVCVEMGRKGHERANPTSREVLRSTRFQHQLLTPLW